MEHLLATGVIGGAHGVQGYVKVTSFSGELEHFCSLKQVTLVRGDARVERLVEDVRPAGNRLLLKLTGIDTPEAARRWTHWEVWVPRDKAAPLTEGEHYVNDLVGCVVVFEGKTVGTVRGVVTQTADVLVEVNTRDGHRAFVPLRDEFVGEVDTEAGTMELVVDWILA